MGYIILHFKESSTFCCFCWFSCASSFPCPWKIHCEARIAGCGFGGWESGEIPPNPKTGVDDRSTRWWWSWLMVVLVLLKLLVKVMVQQPWIADSGENLSILGILLKLYTQDGILIWVDWDQWMDNQCFLDMVSQVIDMLLPGGFHAQDQTFNSSVGLWPWGNSSLILCLREMDRSKSLFLVLRKTPNQPLQKLSLKHMYVKLKKTWTCWIILANF